MTYDENTRLIRNSLMLYLRMLLSLGVSVYTSRLILQALGVEDFGINNVVTAVMGMMYMVTSSMSMACGRFITFALGEGDKQRLKRIFISAVNIHLILSIIAILLTETIGIWFIINKLTISPERMHASIWALQGAMAIFVIGLLNAPYDSVIVAHERMSTFAYISIFDVFTKLIIALALDLPLGDNLILLSLLLVIQALIKHIIYRLYCVRRFEECIYHIKIHAKEIKEITRFAGWSYLGSISGTLKQHGINIMINIFTGPAINAARAVAMQVNTISNQFVENFTTAVDPQLTKSYATNRTQRLHNLIYSSSRMSFYMLMLLSIPLMLETEAILTLWLDKYPEGTPLFIRLLIADSLICVLYKPIAAIQRATGKIRYQSICVSMITILNIPLSYIILNRGFAPQFTVLISAFLSLLSLLSQIYILSRTIEFSLCKYINQVCLRVLLVYIISLLPPLLLFHAILPSLSRILLLSVTSILSSSIAIWYFGINGEERQKIATYAKSKLVENLKRKIISEDSK